MEKIKFWQTKKSDNKKVEVAKEEHKEEAKKEPMVTHPDKTIDSYYANKIKAKRQELEKKEEELKAWEERLEEKEDKLSALAKKDTHKKAPSSLPVSNEKADAEMHIKMKELVVILSAMKEDAAAKVLLQLEPAMSAKMIGLFSKEKAAKFLSIMPAAQAAKITQAMTNPPSEKNKSYAAIQPHTEDGRGVSGNRLNDKKNGSSSEKQMYAPAGAQNGRQVR